MSAFAVADEQIAHLRIERVLAIQAERPAHDGPLTSHDSTPARSPPCAAFTVIDPSVSAAG